MDKKINRYLIVIIICCVLTGAALIRCLLALFLSMTNESPIADYDVALVGFVGAVTGVFIPLFIGQRSELKKEQKEMDNLVNGVYDEIASIYVDLKDHDIFSFETPAWESFKLNYIRYSGIDSQISQGIIGLYTNIIYLKNLFERYNKSENDVDRISLLKDICFTKEEVTLSIESILNVQYIECESIDDGFGAQIKKLADNTERDDKDYKYFEKIFNDKNMLEGFYKKKNRRGFFFAHDAEKYIYYVFNQFSKTSFWSKIKVDKYYLKLIYRDSNKVMFLIYHTNEDVLATSYAAKAKANYSKEDSNYIEILPAILMHNGLSPIEISSLIVKGQYEELAKLIDCNVTNENVFNYVFYKSFFIEDAITHLINYLLDNPNKARLSLICTMIVKYYQSFVISDSVYGFNQLLKIKTIGPNKEFSKFLIAFGKSYFKKDSSLEFSHNFELADRVYGLYLEILFKNQFLSDAAIGFTKQKYSDEEICALFEKQKESIKEFCEILSSDINKVVDNDLLNMYKEVIIKLPNVLYGCNHFANKHFNKEYIDSISDALHYFRLCERNNVSNFKQYYYLGETIKNFFIANIPLENKEGYDFIDNLLNKMLTIATESNNLFLKETYYFLVLDWLDNILSGILLNLSFVDKRNEKDLENLISNAEYANKMIEKTYDSGLDRLFSKSICKPEYISDAFYRYSKVKSEQEELLRKIHDLLEKKK